MSCLWPTFELFYTTGLYLLWINTTLCEYSSIENLSCSNLDWLRWERYPSTTILVPDQPSSTLRIWRSRWKNVCAGFPNIFLGTICVILSPLPHLRVLVLGWRIALQVCRGIGAWFPFSAENSIKKVIPICPHESQECNFELLNSHLLQSDLQITCRK